MFNLDPDKIDVTDPSVVWGKIWEQLKDDKALSIGEVPDYEAAQVLLLARALQLHCGMGARQRKMLPTGQSCRR